MEQIRKNHKLIDLFCELVSIPSPSLKEEKVINKILSIFRENNIQAKQDEYGNVKAFIDRKSVV